MDTWGISGPQFLLLYVVLLAGSVLVAVMAGRRAWPGRARGGRPGPPRPARPAWPPPSPAPRAAWS